MGRKEELRPERIKVEPAGSIYKVVGLIEWEKSSRSFAFKILSRKFIHNLIIGQRADILVQLMEMPC